MKLTSAVDRHRDQYDEAVVVYAYDFSRKRPVGHMDTKVNAGGGDEVVR